MDMAKFKIVLIYVQRNYSAAKEFRLRRIDF